MSLLLPEKIPESIDEALKNVTQPVTINIGKTLGDLWFLVMGGISQAANKKRAKYAEALKKYEESIQKKSNAVPNERRVEPDTQTVCQALEDSKFCLEHDEIRDMFVNLIVSAIDYETCDMILPSYSKILMQMTPNDALFFKKFSDFSSLPICKVIRKGKGKDTFKTLTNDIFMDSPETDEDTISAISLSISSLERLGLIVSTYEEFIAEPNIYDVFEQSIVIQNLKKKHEDAENIVEISRGIIEITSIGENLLEVCCQKNNS